MIRLAHITSDYLPQRGGAEVYIATLKSLLADEGIEQDVYQIATDARGPDLYSVPRFPGALGRNRGFAVWFYNICLPFLWSRLRHYDLLLVHYPFHYPPVAWHRRTIILSHGVEWDIPPRRLTHRIRKRVAEWATRRASATVANDTFFFRELGFEAQPGQNFFQQVAPGKWLIPNCVDHRRFEGAEPIPMWADRNTVLVARNLSPARGSHLAIEAFARFAAVIPDAHLLFVGNFPSVGYARLLKSLAEKHGLTGQITYAGSVPYPLMPVYYASAKLNLVPSIKGEGTSFAALEAMAAGIATVTTDIGGLADLPAVKAPIQADRLADAMIETFRNRQDIAARQQSEVRDRLNLANWKSAWMNVIHAVLDET